MRNGCDSDGVVDNFGDGVHDTLKAKGLGHLWKSGPTPKPFWNWYEDWGWSYDEFKELVDWGVDHGYVFSGHWREHAIESMQRIVQMGHQLIIITDRAFGSDPSNSRRNTIEAYQNAGVQYDEMHFTSDKTSVPVDTMVEDKLSNYDALVANGTATWLINRPWNEVEGGDARNRIGCVCEYADAIQEITNNGFADLSFA